MRRALMLAIVQVGAMLAWAGQSEYVRATAPVFRVPLRPVDPFDLLRGRYFRVNLRDQSITTGQADTLLTPQEVERLVGPISAYPRFVGAAQVGFCPQDGLMRICALRRLDDAQGGSGQFWSRARVRVFRTTDRAQWDVSIDLGLDRFFIPNRAVLPARENESGWELEVCYRPGLAPLARRLFFRGQPVTFS